MKMEKQNLKISDTLKVRQYSVPLFCNNNNTSGVKIVNASGPAIMKTYGAYPEAVNGVEINFPLENTFSFFEKKFVTNGILIFKNNSLQAISLLNHNWSIYGNCGINIRTHFLSPTQPNIKLDYTIE